jgi:hypothetical protein
MDEYDGVSQVCAIDVEVDGVFTEDGHTEEHYWEGTLLGEHSLLEKGGTRAGPRTLGCTPRKRTSSWSTNR